MTIFWIIIFLVSLAVLLKSSDWLLWGAEKIIKSFGISPFVAGAIIVGIGTSLPEFVTSIYAVFARAPEIVSANIVGSNIANIFLVVGLAAIFGKGLMVTKNLIDLDLPIVALSAALFLGVVWDQQITLIEAILLLVTYAIYLAYIFFYSEEKEESKTSRTRLVLKDYLFLILGIVGLYFGAKYLIDAVIALSEIFNVGLGVIAITAVAVGTSAPELIVSIKAAMQGKSEIALGNIFGSNIFNVLVVGGVTGFLAVLPLDEKTYYIGVPAFAMATLLFVISGISRRIHLWEGVFFTALYVLFIGKLFNLF